MPELKTFSKTTLGRSAGFWIAPGETLTFVALPPKEIRLGDLALFSKPPFHVAHRVIARRQDTFFFIKGDASTGSDGWFEGSHILGIARESGRGKQCALYLWARFSFFHYGLYQKLLVFKPLATRLHGPRFFHLPPGKLTHWFFMCTNPCYFYAKLMAARP